MSLEYSESLAACQEKNAPIVRTTTFRTIIAELEAPGSRVWASWSVTCSTSALPDKDAPGTTPVDPNGQVSKRTHSRCPSSFRGWSIGVPEGTETLKLDIYDDPAGLQQLPYVPRLLDLSAQHFINLSAFE